MSLKGSDAVAAERRVDLESLLCVIGRHGPVVAMALFALLSALAAFVIYRAVRTAVRGRNDRKTSERAAPEPQTPSTGVCEVAKVPGRLVDGHSGVRQPKVRSRAKEADETHLNVRHRPAAAAVEKSRSVHTPDGREPTTGSPPNAGQEEPVPAASATAAVSHLHAKDHGMKEEEISEETLKEAHLSHGEVDEAVSPNPDHSDKRTGTGEDDTLSLSGRPLCLKQTLPSVVAVEEALEQAQQTGAEAGTAAPDVPGTPRVLTDQIAKEAIAIEQDGALRHDNEDNVEDSSLDYVRGEEEEEEPASHRGLNDQGAERFSSAVSAPQDRSEPVELQICLPPFEPKGDNAGGGGEESGISSMAASPDAADPENPFGAVATDRAARVEAAAFGPGGAQSEPGERRGHVDAGRGAQEKSADGEGPEDEVRQKTEINIMEATMELNEWIADGAPHFPWMNASQGRPLPPEESAPATDPGDRRHLGESQWVRVTFRLHYVTPSPSQTLAVTGDRRELGNWKDFVPLEGHADGQWAATVGLPPDTRVQWKFVVVEEGLVRRWEECANRLLHTGRGPELPVVKTWGHP
ncbi:uncharacterized protein stbd1 [Stigmatopora argus]